jgi:frataxin-like iron-binding protein CyaY
LREAFLKVAESNKEKGIKVELKGLNHLEVAYGSGSFVLEAETETSTLFYSSPISGTYKYYYDIDQKRFYSNKDGHLLDENLSRETHRYLGDILPL